MLDSLLFPPACIACGRLLRTRRSDHRSRPNANDPGPPLCSRCGIDHAALPESERRTGAIEALFPYQGGLGRALRRLKFEDQPGIAGPLGRLLADASDLRFGRDGRPWDVICHVPLHPTRVWSRGYDQAQLLVEWSAHHLRRRYGLQAPVGRRVLERTRPTVPQSELGLAQRLANLRGAFAVRNPQRLRGRRILVVDDVTTSGATFHACFDALREAGATAVGGLALMRTLHELPSMRATAS